MSTVHLPARALRVAVLDRQLILSDSDVWIAAARWRALRSDMSGDVFPQLLDVGHPAPPLSMHSTMKPCSADGLMFEQSDHLTMAIIRSSRGIESPTSDVL